MTSSSNELSPAERYKRAKEKQKYRELELFAAELKFPLDDFKEQACRALESPEPTPPQSGTLLGAKI